MITDQQIFQRYEKKYLLDERQLLSLLAKLKDQMQQDAFGVHTISNIYYDTENYDLIRTSLDKPVYKEKLRIRGYGTIKESSKVFLEIKKKYKGIVYKRRIALPCWEAQEWMLKGRAPRQKQQITAEIEWFLKIYALMPKVFLAYDRSAWFGNEDSELRVTFDQNIRFRDSALDLTKGSWGIPLLSPKQTLMEIKIPGAMPLWLARELSNLSVTPISFSKYGECYKNYLIQDTDKNKGGIICA